MGLHKVDGLTLLEALGSALSYLNDPPATKALGSPHYGYTGGVNTKEHRKRLRRERKQQEKKG
jgi:hypothetical protein